MLKKKWARLKKICCFPLPLWGFFLFLFAIITSELLKYNLVSTIFDLLKYTVGVIIGGLITYFGQVIVEYTKRQTQELNAAYHVIRTLSDQYMQMLNLEKNLLFRQALLQNIPNINDLSSVDIIPITQDFREDICKIDRIYINGLPLPRKGREKLEESRIKIVLSDRNYATAINSILDLNIAKRELLSKEPMNSFLSFLKKRIPERLLVLQEMMRRNKKDLDEFQKELKNIFGKKFQEMQYGEAYPLD